MTLVPTLYPMRRWLNGRLPLMEWQGDESPAFQEGIIRYGEDVNNYYVQVDLPGVRKEDVRLVIQEGQLELSAERQVGFGSDLQKVTFNRAFNLPDDVQAEKIAAEQKDGVLALTLPKKEEAKPKVVQIDVK